MIKNFKLGAIQGALVGICRGQRMNCHGHDFITI